jgi:hypothetical protein
VLLVALVFVLPAGSAHAAIQYVKNIGTQNSDQSGDTITINVPAAGVAAGNSIIVTFAMAEDTGDVWCIDTQGNIYSGYSGSGSASDVDVSSNNNVRTVIFSAHNVNALGLGDFIIVNHPTITDRAVSAHEFSGLATSSTLDQTQSNDGNATAFSSGATAATTFANELLIGAFGAAGPGSEFSPETTPAWTGLTESTSGSITISSEYREVFAINGYTATGTNSSRRRYAGAIATYKAPCTFDYRRSITIDGDNVGGSSGYLDNFPMLVHLTGAWLKTAPTGDIQNANGYDIIFRGLDATTCDGAALCGLAHEIEEYDGVNGELIAWVRVPKVYAGDGTPSSDTVIYMYYGNTCTTDSDDPQDAAGVWSNNYMGVWHLKEDEADTAPQYQNSLGTNHGTATTMPSGNPVDGQIYKAQTFNDATYNRIDAGSDPSLETTGSRTVEAWVNTTYDQDLAKVVAAKWGGTGSYYWLGKLNQTDFAYYIDGNQSVTTDYTLINDGGWHHVAGVFDSGTNTLKVYVDGYEKNSSGITPSDQTGSSDFFIGNNPDSTIQQWIGEIDEVRVSGTNRSAEWILTEYNNQVWPNKAVTPVPEPTSPTSGFITVGSEEPGPATAISLLSFTATGAGNAVQVDWQTAAEFDNVGFHLYRAIAPGGPYTRLSDKLISARPRQGQGAGYSYVDADVTVGRLYYYKLEDIDVYGKHTMHGPISVDWDADGMPDDWEITRGLNPWVNDADLDSDGDGLSNFEEYERDLDPFNPDTDGDGILDGAEDGRLNPQADSGSRELTRGVEVLAEDDNGVTLELITTGFEAEVVTVDGQEFEKVHIADYVHGYTDELGAPQMPLKGILIDIPAGKVAELSVLKTVVEPYDGYRIFPVPQAIPDNQGATAGVGQAFVQDLAAYNADGFYPQTVAVLGQSYVFRDQIKQQVIFYPIDFNPVSGQLNLYERIRVRIDYVDNTLAKAVVAPAAPWQPPLVAFGSDALSNEQISVLALWMPPIVVNPLPPMLSTISTAIAAFWSPPEGSGSAVYKITTAAAGIYRMDLDFLLAQGLSGAKIDAIDLEQIRLFNLGQEVAIDIDDQGIAGQLDAGDYIEFYAVAVDDAYAKYSAENIYWLTLSGGGYRPP